MTGAGVHRALERLRFGPRRTLNVREGGLTGAEAARRVDAWLRGKQVELDGDVLIITGRGAGSHDGIAVVRDATLRVLRSLKRAGVVAAIQDDTAGSFVVTLAPIRSLLEAPVRRKEEAVPGLVRRESLAGLRDHVRDRLRVLAAHSLESLGMHRPSGSMLDAEMARQFSLLLRSAPPGLASETWLEEAIGRGLAGYQDDA